LTAASAGVVTPAGQNIQELALNYKKDYANGFGLQLSATGLFGGAKTISPNAAPAGGSTINTFGAQSFDDIRSYALGFVMSYAGFSLGGEYLNNGNSLALQSYSKSNGTVTTAYNVTGADAGRMYSVALGYETGRHGITAGYLHSKRNLGTTSDVAFGNFGDVRTNVLSVTYDYKLAKGLKVYAEATSFDFKQSNPTNAAEWHAAAGNGAATSAVGSNNGRALVVGTAISF